MLTRWLITLTACLAVSAKAESGAVTVAPTSRVKGQPETELTLNCGDGHTAGVVQLWHTPYGDLPTPGVHSELDPVFMRYNGSLVIPRASSLHSGLYYCLLQDAVGTTLWPYQLYVGHDPQEKPQLREHDSRSRRDAGPEADRQAAVSDEQFAGAVAASVLLTFVVGFSAGALSRSRVLRCLRVITTRMRLPRKQRRRTARSDQGSEVTRTTFPSTYNNHICEMEEIQDDRTDCVTTETRTSPPTPPAPAKPQRSFRIRQEEEQETPLYLEGCERIREEEEEGLEEETEGRNRVSGETEEEQREFYLLEDGGSQSVADEEECSEDEEEEDGREDGNNETEWRKDEAETDREERRGGDRETDEEEGGRGGEEQENINEGAGGGEGDPACSPACSGRRSRIIRLYQYDEDGQRYCHLPGPAPDRPVPAPRLKQRSLSLTRLNAIMAAASAGPMDTRQEEGEERPRFSMDI